MCAVTALKYDYEYFVESILSKINKKKKKQDFRKVVLKDHNGNKHQMHLSEAC